MKQIIIYIMSQKHTIIATILLLLLASCNPCKRLIRLCPPSDSISYIESIDTIIVTVPASTTEMEFSLGDIGLTEEDENQIVEVVVKDSVVYIRTTCKEQEREIYNLRKHLAAVKTRIERVEIPKYYPKTSKYHSIAGIIAPILLLLIIGGVYLKIKRIV